MEELTQTILELPPTGLIPVVLLLLAGVVLWAAGRRVLRTGFAAAGLILGGVLGWAAGGLKVVDAMNVPVWVFAAVAAVVAALVFAAAYRLVMAAVVALLLAALAPLSVWTAAELGALPVSGGQSVSQETLFAPSPQPTDTSPPTELDRWLEEVFGTPVGNPAEPVIDDQDAAPEPQGDGEASVWQEWWDGASKAIKELANVAWEKSAGSLRPTLFAAAAVGALLGLVLGAAAPAFSAALVTTLGGSIIMLSSGTTLITRALAGRVEMPQGPWTPTTPTGLLAWLLGLTVIGLGIQWMLRAKRADKPAD
ncbi:MAG: hypothetical protein ACYTE6_04630 [Planctomycetota bacterium]|jgi:hypothetical protein